MKTFWLLVILSTTSINSINTLPSSTIERLDGKKVNANTIQNDGKPFVIIFWSTWCSPCKRELNNIHEVYDDWKKKTGVKIIAISTDDVRNKNKVAPYVKSKGWNFDIYIDPHRQMANALEVSNPPHTFLFNGKGEMVWSHKGYIDGDEEKILEQIQKIK